MLYTIIYLILTAVVLAFVFSSLFNNRGPWGSFWVFMLILFLGMFAFALWVPPLGPVWYGVAWLDSLLIGLLLALLLGAAAEPERREIARDDRGEVDLVAEAKAERGAMTLFGIFFWIFMVVISILVLFGVARFIQLL